MKLSNLPSRLVLLSLGAIVYAQNSSSTFCSTLAERHIINLAQAGEAIAAAQQQASSIRVSASIAVTDPAGFLVAFARNDNARLLSVDVSQRKARTVSLFAGAFTTAALYNLTQPGAALFGITETNGGLVALGGGVPVFRDGFFIGAIGVSGGSSDQDVTIATAGAQAVGSLTQSRI
ncbi:hypothetical protein B0A49_11670 [Cryomyces minteri]|uniref:15.0 kDa protein in dhaT-dhaS intergenic region n=1 Tax=Cryomyces minteri TaxID=331657 RepID=A0A4U0WGN3_9PEZI|nr:hypothetical protein B0A49_13684 [Cryomyces minteri]TKA61513.1 hypothetical protein B0A49_11670 [Cryomyces minteri]